MCSNGRINGGAAIVIKPFFGENARGGSDVCKFKPVRIQALGRLCVNDKSRMWRRAYLNNGLIAGGGNSTETGDPYAIVAGV